MAVVCGRGFFGGIAQLVEHAAHIRAVIGSIPIAAISLGDLSSPLDNFVRVM